MKKSLPLWLSLLLLGSGPLRAEFLFDPVSPSPNGFMTPTLDYGSVTYEYSAWDIFYAPHTVGNYPDLFAPYGGYWNGTGWTPETRTAANNNTNGSNAQKPAGGFVASPLYNPSNALAFWDTRNATITQGATSAFIIGPDISGNIYTYSQKTSYVLKNNPDYDQLGSVIFQFQTDGNLVDFSSIKLTYSDGFSTFEIAATAAEYLREYHVTGGGHWSAAGGYSNRVAIQWDMSGITDPFGNPITDYQIRWDAASTSMSLQKVDLVTSDTYEAGIPISAAWSGSNGNWSQESQWTLNESSGLTAPQQNGNIRFQNTAPASVNLDQNFSLGELIFENAGNVTIASGNGSKLSSNTGVTTRTAATGTYTVDTDMNFGALNFFEINAGAVVMNGELSGSHGLVKSGAGTLVLAHDNTFSGFLAVQGGTVRVEGNNAYSGGTTVVNGRMIVAADAGAAGALGTSTEAVSLGADAGLYEYAAGADWKASLWIDGDHAIGKNIALAAGDFEKRLGAMNTASGATYSGNISLTSASANPDSLESAAGNVWMTAREASDRVTFSGAITGGNTSKTITLDGEGTVVYAGANKTYANATSVASGTLLIQSGTSYTGSGNITVAENARLQIDGGVTGSGNVTINKGALHVDGVLAGSGNLILNEASLSGFGTISRAIVANAGAVLSPGNSPGQMDTGAQTWGGGASYVWEINSLSGGEGVGWDHFNITGSLNITALAGNEFVLQITSLDAANASGLLAGFDADADASWVIATASGGILGFSEKAFLLNTDDFLNPLNGSFSLGLNGNDLVLNYTSAIPEPSTHALIFMSAAGFAAFHYFRRKKSLHLQRVKSGSPENSAVPAESGNSSH